MPTLQATTTVTQEVILKPSVRRRLLVDLKAYAEMKAQRDVLDFKMGKFKESIEATRESTGEVKLELDGFRIALVSPTRSTLSKKLLLENGVTMGQIENSTVVKATKSYCKVTVPGEKEREYE